MKSILIAALLSVIGLSALSQATTKNTKVVNTQNQAKSVTKNKTAPTKVVNPAKKETPVKEGKPISLTAMLKSDSTKPAGPDSLLVPKQ